VEVACRDCVCMFVNPDTQRYVLDVAFHGYLCMHVCVCVHMMMLLLCVNISTNY